MSPLVDQDGTERDEQKVFLVIEVSKIIVRHDEILLFDGADEPALQVSRPRHPGAGLALDIADSVKYEVQ